MPADRYLVVDPAFSGIEGLWLVLDVGNDGRTIAECSTEQDAEQIVAALNDVAWWETHEGRTRAEVEQDEAHNAEWDRLEALSDDEVCAELLAEGIDPEESTDRVFNGVIHKMAGGHAAMRKMTAERDHWRERATAQATLLRLQAALDEPLSCGHPLECLPEHAPMNSGTVRCGWCAEVARLRSLLADVSAAWNRDPDEPGWEDEHDAAHEAIAAALLEKTP
jgi:hypothetical protein